MIALGGGTSQGQQWSDEILAKFPSPIYITLFGLLLLIVNVTFLAVDSADKKGGDLIAEDAIDLCSRFPLLFKFLIFEELVESSEGLTAIALTGLDVIIFSLVDPIVHGTAGFGKEILN